MSPRPFRAARLGLSAAAVAAALVVGGALPAAAVTTTQAGVGANTNCNLDGLHQNTGPVSTCRSIDITTQILVNGVDVPAASDLAVGDVITVRVTIPPRGSHDAMYQETVDGIRNNNDDLRFVIDVGLPAETGTYLTSPSGVTMSRTDQGDRGNGPAINCLAHNGQEGARSDAPTVVAPGGGAVGGTAMSAAVTSGALTAVWDDLAWDRCVNVLSNNGFYAGFTLEFTQSVIAAPTTAITPTWSLGQVDMARDDGSRRITWGVDSTVGLTLVPELGVPMVAPAVAALGGVAALSGLVAVVRRRRSAAAA